MTHTEVFITGLKYAGVYWGIQILWWACAAVVKGEKSIGNTTHSFEKESTNDTT